MISIVKNKIYPTWNELYKNSNVFDLPWVSKDIHPVLKQVIDNLPMKKGVALDVGCGLGQVSRYLAQVGFRTTGIDISDEAISLCDKLNNTGKQINYQVANSITFNSKEKFDLIIDFLHIHDIERENIEQYLKNIEKLLSKNGYLIISTFSQNDKSNKNTNVRKSNFVQQNINYYSKHEILNLLVNEYIIVNNKSLTVGKNDESYKSYILILKRKYNE